MTPTNQNCAGRNRKDGWLVVTRYPAAAPRRVPQSCGRNFVHSTFVVKVDGAEEVYNAERRDGGESILRGPSLRLAGMNLVCQLDQLALDPVGEIDDALHVAIADGANVIKPGRRSERFLIHEMCF